MHIPFSTTACRAAGIAIAAITCGVVSAEPVSTGSDAERLLSALEEWLDQNSAYARPPSAPTVRVIPPAIAADLAGGLEAGHLGRLRGLFDPETSTIYLVSPWDVSDPEDVSVLLHELVHHRQAKQHWYCPAEQEWDAYKLQAAWLTELGIKPDFYWPAILLSASCGPRDVHPG